MRKFLFFPFALFFLSTLGAEERIAGTLDQVDLIATDVKNEDGHNYGEKYSAFNRNDVPMRITIRLTEAENVESYIVPHTLITEPHTQADLGYILQKDVSKNAAWKYEWQAKPDSQR